MNDTTANRYAENWIPVLRDCKDENEYKRQLRLLVKEVDRDTRFKCIDAINKLAHEVHNLQ